MATTSARRIFPCPEIRGLPDRAGRVSCGMMRPLFLLTAVLTVRTVCAGPAVSAKRQGTQIIFRAGEREMFRYQAEPGPLPRPDIMEAFRRGGYLSPLLTPSGKLISDDFPPNHLHHHGVWWAWTKTEFEGRKPDFWNMGDNRGRVEFVAVDAVWEKEGAAGFTARHQFMDLLASPPKAALLETWDIRATAEDGPRPRWVIDLTSTQTCAGTAPLKLPDYHYGGLGFRGHRTWDGAENARFLTSSGITGRVAGNTSTARWLWTGGSVEGGIAGITILSHPDNFRAPQPLRIHPTEPFICFAPQQSGPMEIKPGTPYVSRYRLIAADGQPAAAEAEGWWEAYAKPAAGEK